VLKDAEALNLEQIPAEREFVESHSFRYRADVGRFMFVQIDKNLRSFGGYLSPRTERFIVRVPPFPPELKILSQGSLLALSGERKVAALVRDLPGVRIDVARLLPAQLQHLVSQSNGDFANPSFYGSFGPDNVTERFVRKRPHGRLARRPADRPGTIADPGRQGTRLLAVQRTTSVCCSAVDTLDRTRSLAMWARSDSLSRKFIFDPDFTSRVERVRDQSWQLAAQLWRWPSALLMTPGVFLVTRRDCRGS
jgi:hypothetical protein